MKKYIVRRDVPSIGQLSRKEWSEKAARSNKVIEEMHPHLQWVESFIGSDTAYCIYLATDEGVVREHSERVGYPAHAIHEIGTEVRPRDALDSAQARAKDTYEATADCYDAPPLGFWDRAGRRTVDLLRLDGGARVLDVGCGTGSSALPAAERIGPDGDVLGIDLAEGLLDLARAKAASRGLGNLRFKPGDMTDLELEESSFDAVICVLAVFFAPDMSKFVRDLWRLVRPGGELAITTWGPRMFQPAASIWKHTLQETRPDLTTEFNPWDQIKEPKGLEALFSDAGLPTPNIHSAEDQQPLDSPEDWWTIVRGSGLRWTIEQLTPAETEKIRQFNLKALADESVSAVECNTIHALAKKEP